MARRRRPKQQRFDLGDAGKKAGRARAAGRKVGRAGSKRARKVASKARIQMSGRIPPIRGRKRGRINHPSTTPRSRATRVGSVFGRQAGHTAGGFANEAAKAYRQTRTGPKFGAHVKRAATSKGAKYAVGGAAGAVALKAGYGLAKARAGRSQQITQINVVHPAPEQPRRRRGVLHRRGRRVRRDRYGRFR